MKYFLDIETMFLYSVPKKYQHLIDEVSDGVDDEAEGTEKINKAREEIIRLCKVKLAVDCASRYL